MRGAEGKAGRCGASATLRVARSALHFWEEPPISGERGSGAIFFSGCPLRCVFCQNHEISQEGFGLEVTTARLAQMMLELEAQGALNINLVTPLHFAPHVREAVRLRARRVSPCPSYATPRATSAPRWCAPCPTWLTSGSPTSSTPRPRWQAPSRPWRTIRRWRRRRSRPCWPPCAGRRSQDGGGRSDAAGIIVRHLVLPGHVDDSLRARPRVGALRQRGRPLGHEPVHAQRGLPRKAGGPLSGPLDPDDYELVLDYADALGFERMWWQQGGTVSESFVPAFDATGVEGPELGKEESGIVSLAAPTSGAKREDLSWPMKYGP